MAWNSDSEYMEQHRNSLQPGFRLHWYYIKKILGQGGFGITYLAQDTNLNQLVAIKEYLPIELAVREDGISVQPVSGEHGEQYKWGLDRFISEAQTLARFKHVNIVRVLAVFNENNTAYMVMEYEQGRGMHDILREKKTIGEADLKKILMPILDGLEAVHAANFIHRDIKPPNIYIRGDGSPVLLDFGSARQALSEQTRTMTTMVSPGYAPFEQYVSKSSRQGPWTDIYGLAATLYRSVTGITPQESMDRSEALLHTGKDIYVPVTEIAAGQHSQDFLAAIDHGLAFKPEQRPQSIAEWRREIGGIGRHRITARPAATPGSEVNTVAVVTEPVVENAGAIRIGQQPSLVGKLIDRIYGTTKKFLKWGLVVLGVLLAIGILTEAGKQRDRPRQIERTPEIVMEQPASEESPTGIAVTEQEKAKQVPEEKPQTAEMIEQLLADAEKDMAELRLTLPRGNNAAEKYRQVLDLEPDNTAAKKGLDRIVLEYLRMVNRALSNHDIPLAGDYVSRVAGVDPGHPDLPAAREKLEAARLAELQREREQQRVLEERKQEVPPQIPPETQTASETGQPRSLVPESERRALHDLREQIRANPDDTELRKKLGKLAERYEDNIRRAVRNGEYALAEDYVDEIRKISGDNPRTKKRLEELLLAIEKQKTGAVQ